MMLAGLLACARSGVPSRSAISEQWSGAGLDLLLALTATGIAPELHRTSLFVRPGRNPHRRKATWPNDVVQLYFCHHGISEGIFALSRISIYLSRLIRSRQNETFYPKSKFLYQGPFIGFTAWRSVGAPSIPL